MSSFSFGGDGGFSVASQPLLAVTEKIIGLALFLDFFDCGASCASLFLAPRALGASACTFGARVQIQHNKKIAHAKA